MSPQGFSFVVIENPVLVLHTFDSRFVLPFLLLSGCFGLVSSFNALHQRRANSRCSHNGSCITGHKGPCCCNSHYTRLPLCLIRPFHSKSLTWNGRWLEDFI